MIWPTTSRRLTQYFKWNHAGIDIGEPTGSPLYASDEGIVEYAGWGRGGWGNTILINHGDGRKTRYSHASRILVHVGDFVSKGQTIALSGNTGRSTGPHLDFRIYINGRTVNPLDYVR
jgi:murein DD-endopeptidase MepM/ murein hydrolase activator NlpD